MNLFVTMIPLLLLTAAFYHIGMVSVSVPTQSEEESDVAAGKTSVTINLRMTRQGVTAHRQQRNAGRGGAQEPRRLHPQEGQGSTTSTG